MAAKKVGVLVKEARTAAGLTQEKLAKAAGENLTAADISKCERGEADLTAAQLKRIAVACGVTQTSLVNAPKNLSAAAAKKAAAKDTKTGGGKTASAKAPAARKETAKTTAKAGAKTSTAKAGSAKTSTAKAGSAKTSAAKAAAKKTGAAAVPANANVSMKVTAAEQKLIQAYRGSTADRKKAALKLLNGDYGDAIDKVLSVTNGSTSASSSSSSGPDLIGDVLGSVLGGLLGGK